MPGGKPLRLGPFVGGLNTASDPTAIADAELVECENFELDIDGSLVSRPPMQEIEGHTSFTERIVVLCEAIFSGNHYLIGSNINGVFHYLNGAWTLITSTFKATAAVQYADKVYLIAHPSAANPGGKWDPTGGFTAVAAIPKGGACTIHKERLFVVPGIDATVNTSRLTFSDTGNFDSWPGANFIDIGQGDGTKLLDLIVYQDNILLFKDQTSYVLAYDVRPTDAVMRKVSESIGVEGQHCVISFENQVYVLHNGWVYEIINLDFHRLNTKTPFVLDQTSPSPFSASESICLAIMGDRLVVRFYSKTYVYGLKTRTWGEWKSVKDKLHYFGPIVTVRKSTSDEYYAGSAITAFKSLVKLIDIQTASDKETVLDPIPATTDSYTRASVDSWGNATTGEAWTNILAPNTAYQVNGSEGVISISAISSARRVAIAKSLINSDVTIMVKPTVLATGAANGQIIVDLETRRVDDNNKYICRIYFDPAGANVYMEIRKVVAGVESVAVAGTGFGAYVANEQFGIRFRVNGTSLRARLWRVAGSSEPTGWHISGTDANISASGNTAVSAQLGAGNTNPLPVAVNFDNLAIGDLTNLTADITCSIKTKNFDMAASAQFKRLWWWGVDVISNRDITGIASPVVVSFDVTWDMLAAYSWDDLETWDQPLTEISSVATVVATGTGTARRFAKFLKSLRYRQINFEVRLLTDGSTVDGPARTFTITIVTETKQGVSKAIS